MQRFPYLWQQYSGKKATREELDELFQLMADPGNEMLVLSFLERLAEQTAPMGAYKPEQFQFLIDNALTNKNVDIDTAGLTADDPTEDIVLPVAKKAVRKLNWLKYAAAIIIIAGAGLYIWKPWAPQTPVAQKEAGLKNDAAPGTNKAVLTLSNGATVLLDSNRPGTIGRQGNANLQNNNNGTLSYNIIDEKPAGELVYNTLTTPRGGVYQLILPDGSKVWLNAASSITYPAAFGATERRVNITGEAYFEVKHEAKRPFRVMVAGQLVEDIGTSFNVNAYVDEPEIRITLAEGIIDVNHMRLKPGQQAVIKEGRLKIGSGIDLDEVLAWKNGRIIFSQTDLAAVLRQFSRWYNVDIVYEGKIPERRFGGDISRNINLSEALKILEELKIHFRIEGQQLIVMP